MKIFILTEGGKDIGSGHLTRCIALYQAFEEREIIPEFIVNSDSLIEGLLKGIRYQIFNWLKQRRILFNLIHNAGIAIIDSYLADLEFYKKISEKVKICVYIDDYKRLDYPKGVIVNGGIYAKKLDYPRMAGVSHLLGSQYIPIRKEFWDVKKRRIRNRIKNILVTFGSNDRTNMTLTILKFLNDNYNEFSKIVIIGRGFQNTGEIKKIRDKKTNLIYNPDGKKVKEIMMESNLAISAGGQTLYELARVGVPTIGICIAENQRMNLEGWERKGFLEYIGWYNRKDLLSRLNAAILKFLSKEERNRRSRIGINCVDGKGAIRVIDYLIR